MIITVTLNPCIDLNLEVEALPFGAGADEADRAREAPPLRALSERRRAGGKGMNVASVLQVLGTPSQALCLLGGAAGREFGELAQRQGVALIDVAAPGNTRTNIVLTARRDGSHLKVNQQGGEIGRQQIDDVIETLDDCLNPDDALVLAGSLPPGAPPETYAELIERYRDLGVFVALDADGESLRLGIEARPHLVKPNREELERAIGLAADTPEQRLLAACTALERGAGLCLVTDGPRPAYLVHPEGLLRATAPEVTGGSPVGAGDCCLAGFLHGLLSDAPQPLPERWNEPRLRHALRYAVAAGSASCGTPDTEYFQREALEPYLSAVAVERISFT